MRTLADANFWNFCYSQAQGECTPYTRVLFSIIFLTFGKPLKYFLQRTLNLKIPAVPVCLTQPQKRDHNGSAVSLSALIPT